jgi:hypothetical protein
VSAPTPFFSHIFVEPSGMMALADQSGTGPHAMNPRRIITSAIGALVITAMSVVASFEQSGFPSARRHLADLASLPALPGAFVVAALGVGHGPGGMPNDRDVLVVYVLTFLLWWGVICRARVWWTSLK